MRSAPLVAGLDPWFEERGYKRAGKKTEWKKTLPGGIELRSDATLSLYGETEPRSSLEQFVRLPRFAKLHRAAIANSSFRGDPGSGAGLVLHPREIVERQPREIDGVGPKWEEFLAQFGPVIEANEAQLREHADDLRPVVDGPYFDLAIGVYRELFLILHAGDFAAARAWLDDCDYEAVLNPRHLKLRPGKLTAEEEYQQACRVFSEYMEAEEAKRR